MSNRGERAPDDFQEVIDRLRARRPSPTALELDEIKLRAMRQAQASTRQGKGMVMRKKLTSVALAIGALTTGGTAAVIAGGQAGGDGNGGKGEYNPGCDNNNDGKGHKGKSHQGRSHCPKQTHQSHKGSHNSHGGGKGGGGQGGSGCNGGDGGDGLLIGGNGGNGGSGCNGGDNNSGGDGGNSGNIFGGLPGVLDGLLGR